MVVSDGLAWVTDLEITPENILPFMRGGRARWKIENEIFNTLKNQGYHFEHNFGLGKQHLATAFANLMMLAFLVDQIQQRCCKLFQKAQQKAISRTQFWSQIRRFLRALSSTVGRHYTAQLPLAYIEHLFPLIRHSVHRGQSGLR